MGGWYNKVHRQRIAILLADKVHEQDPERRWLHFIQPSLAM